ncbi:UNVERIFIED_CONTAM: hypothetical protein RMT77_006529 [Armadillidium vulgare]
MFYDDGLRRMQADQNQFINSRILKVEKHFGELCDNFAGYARKKAKLRDKGDELTKALSEYAEAETLNKSLRSALFEVANINDQVQDFRNEEINRIEQSVVSPLSSYRKICQNTREELRESFDLRRKDINRKKALERTVSGNRFSQPSKQVITDGDSVIKKSEENLRKSFLKVEEKIDGFEEKKIEDLKNILLDFIKTELAFHSKSVELFTKAYGEVSRIKSEEDLEDFQNARDIYDRELRNALGFTNSRSDVMEHENEYNISPVILGPKKKQKDLNEMKKSVENVKVHDYEDIETEESSSDD